MSTVPAAEPARTVAQATSRSGNFVTAAHSTQGMVSLVTDNGQRYLKFDETFKTDNGPDLMVLLHRQTVPKSYSKENYESLGPLQQVSGTQGYRIPADVNPEDFSSVVIWCRKFNVTLAFRPRYANGYATLSN
ncbi:MAG: DM13 domain-containing protein [Moorea sp. SIO1F2]|uniref:DM13 domain-containing protein n=1 Tax=Moorena sp. SIO1F2 TaxID=2607819 RepID=UPI0013B81D71|nr:DM13 domain-containing protein [Moorena sp. SIO1F2]NET81622.1 DM13 domain-containing protein [Moorena sp. SIO1F2]